VPWFTVRPSDFANPDLPRQILDTYGEARGDGVKRQYRFPVVFPADLWQLVMPHQLAAWGANEKKYWGDYAADGRERYCKTYAPLSREGSGKRVLRSFGGRKTMLREDNGGLCDPERCPQFQNRRATKRMRTSAGAPAGSAMSIAVAGRSMKSVSTPIIRTRFMTRSMAC
jgi:hypothetical protein